jgi:N-acetyl-anhydromuramyl-L-alanine amidase AmpD
VEIKKASLTFTAPLEKRKSTDFIILHHAAATHATIYDIEKWHKEKGYIGVGYNYYITKLGEIYEGRPIWASDADAWGHNYDSLSICFEGDYDKELEMPKAQIEAGVALIRYLRGEYPKVRLVRHCDVNNDTVCPGKYFNIKIITEGMIDITVKAGDYHEALAVLKEHGITNSPDYWLGAVKYVKYLDALFVNMANALLKK